MRAYSFLELIINIPADPPANRCVLVLSSRWSRSASAPRPCACPRNCLAFSYTEKCTTVYGTFIRTVVRYDLYLLGNIQFTLKNIQPTSGNCLASLYTEKCTIVYVHQDPRAV